jgi:glycosyl transferase, family 25
LDRISALKFRFLLAAVKGRFYRHPAVEDKSAKKIKVFVINLTREANRRKFMEEQLKSCGLPFEIFDAIDGSLIPDLDELCKSAARPLSAGEVGCHQSHVCLWRRISAENDHDWFLILEDDVILLK